MATNWIKETVNKAVNDATNKARFAAVKTGEQAALSDLEKTYGGMISESDKYYQDQIDASKEWADKQTQLQNEKTDFAIEKIEQQKAQAKSDYTKEQSGAYVDWQKQSNQYGANAEKMAASGMTNTGYSESSQVSMYNAYQNRVAMARDAFERAKLNYDNAITEARLQNNSVLAEIAYETYQKQLELSLQGFQHKNQLILDKANKKIAIQNTYYNRYQDVLQQINSEKALAEEARQFNAQLAEEKRQFNALHSDSGSNGSSRGSINKETSSSGTANIGGLTINTSKKTTQSSSPEIDMDSVIALGYGPISASQLNELVASGKVEEYMENGKRKFRNVYGPYKTPSKTTSAFYDDFVKKKST